MNYLQKRDNCEEAETFKFLLRYEAFTKASKNDKKRLIFLNILQHHFDIEEQVLSLSNASISDYLCQRKEDFQEAGTCSLNEEDIKYLKAARNDAKVWSEGFEATYQVFLTKVSTSRLACILSIL